MDVCGAEGKEGGVEREGWGECVGGSEGKGVCVEVSECSGEG